MIGSKLNNKVKVVGLNPCLVSGAISYHGAAFLASVNYYIASLGIRLGACGAKYTAACICSVTWVNIHVERAKAKGAVIS